MEMESRSLGQAFANPGLFRDSLRPHSMVVAWTKSSSRFGTDLESPDSNHLKVAVAIVRALVDPASLVGTNGSACP